MFPRGSEWRVWDLQVQTILDDNYVSLRRYYSEIKTADAELWETFTTSLGGEENALRFDSKEYFNDSSIPKKERCTNYTRTLFQFVEIFRPELGLIGFTDHNYWDDELLDSIQSYQEGSTCKALVGVEINVSGVHMLVYFEHPPFEQETFSQGIRTFLQKIDVDKPKNSNGVLSVSNKSINDVVKIIESQNGIYIFAHCNSDNGLFQERGKTDRTYLADVYNSRSPIILQSKSKSSGEKVMEFIAGRATTLTSIAIMTIASDSRRLDEIGAPDADNNSLWVKADPSFEGFRQVQYEPEERVAICSDNPFLDFDKPFFDTISISAKMPVFGDEAQPEFEPVSIPLNQNMISIIGGRGEGKSILVDFLASRFVDQKVTHDNYSDASGVDLTFFKTNQDSKEFETLNLGTMQSVDFVYINQGEIKTIVDVKDRASLANSIRKMAKIAVPKFDDSLDQELTEKIEKYHEIYDYLNEEDSSGQKVNQIEKLESRRSQVDSFIKNITTTENKEKLTRFGTNISSIRSNGRKKEKLEEFTTDLIKIRSEISERIREFQDQGVKLTPLNEGVFDDQVQSIEEAIKTLDKQIAGLEKQNQDIKSEFKDYKGDLTTLLSDIDKFQKQLLDIESQISRIKESQKLSDELEEEIFKGSDEVLSLIDQVIGVYESHKVQLVDSWNEFSDIQNRMDLNPAQKDLMNEILNDVSIEGEIEFSQDDFYRELSHCIDGSAWRIKHNRSSQLNHFGIKDVATFFDYLKEKYLKDYYESGVHRLEFMKLFFDQEKRAQYLKIYPVIKYQGKNLNKLSVGQKGTVYLKMKLATEAFSKPIIFDQPEDDLDNDFIVKNLIGMFKSLKKYRQVIIVTHNANLVVNADSEQVIIAHNNNEVINYTSGSLENEGINKEICRILEGGEGAFEKRRNRYRSCIKKRPHLGS